MGLAMAAIVVLAAPGFEARADVLLGGGSIESECYGALDTNDLDGATVEVKGKKTTVTCTDGDPCDADGECNGSCLFTVGTCINVAGVEGCTAPGVLDSASVKGSVKGVKGSSGKVTVDVPQLLEGSVCGAFVDVVMPLKETKKGQKARKAKLSLKAKAPKGTKPRKDSDKFYFVCEPAPEGCTGGSPSGAFVAD